MVKNGLTSVTNRAFSAQHACHLSTTPTLLACADATAHAQARYWKGSSSHKTALLQYYSTMATECAGYIYALQGHDIVVK